MIVVHYECFTVRKVGWEKVQMKTKIFGKILGLDGKLSHSSVLNEDLIRDNERMIIPREYLIEVITTIPDRKVVIERLDIYQE